MTSTAPADGVRTARRAALASLVGTTIEWYDYYIFGTAAVLVLNSQFFPALDPLAATLASFATFGVAFVARPVGGALFGHFGDRVSRKKTLVVSIFAMGGSTLVVGLLPTYAQIGVWAPVLLVACRFVQGLAVGGEWGGAVLMALEHAPADKRAFYASWPQVGVPAGTLLSAGSFALVQLLPDDQLLAWGWRLPFLASVVLVAVGLVIRLKVEESPDFRRVQRRGQQVRVPAAEVFRRHKASLLAGMLCGAAPNMVFYLSTVFLLSYAPERAGAERSTVLLAVMAAALVEVVTMPYLASLADRVGARRTLVAGSLVVLLGAFPVFWLVDTGRTWGLVAALLLMLPVAHGCSYAVVSSVTAQLFPAHVRFSGTALAYQLGGVLTSAPVPIVATLLLARSGTSAAIACYAVVSAAVGIAAVLRAPRPVVDVGDTTATTLPSVASHRSAP